MQNMTTDEYKQFVTAGIRTGKLATVRKDELHLDLAAVSAEELPLMTRILIKVLAAEGRV